MKNKWFVIIISLLFLLASCSPSSSLSTTEIPVSIFFADAEDERFQMFYQGFCDEAKRVGLCPSMIDGAGKTITEVVELLKTTVTSTNAKYVVIWNGHDSFSELIEDWHGQNIQTICAHHSPVYDTLDTEGILSHVTCDHDQRGRLAADTMVSMLAEKGITQGTIGLIQPSDETVYPGINAFISRISEIAPEFSCLTPIAVGYTENTLTERVVKLYQENTDMVGIYSDVEFGGEIIASAAHTVADDSILIVCDETESAHKSLEQGELSAILAIDLYEEGRKTAQIVSDIDHNAEVDSTVTLPYRVIRE